MCYCHRLFRAFTTNDTPLTLLSFCSLLKTQAVTGRLLKGEPIFPPFGPAPPQPSPDCSPHRIAGLIMNELYELGMREQHGRNAKLASSMFPTVTELHNKDVRMIVPDPLHILRVLAGAKINDNTCIIFESTMPPESKSKHTTTVVLKDGRRFTFGKDFSPSRHMSCGLIRDSGSTPSFSTVKFAKDALCWYLMTCLEGKGPTGWPFSPSAWLRYFFGRKDLWTEWCLGGPRFILLGNHRNANVRSPCKKRKVAGDEPALGRNEAGPAVTAQEAEITAAVCYQNGTVRIAFAKGGTLKKPFVIAENFILDDAPVRRKRVKEEAVDVVSIDMPLGPGSEKRQCTASDE